MSESNGIDAAEVLILEADGLIDETHGYGYPISRRLEELEIRSEKISIAGRTDRLRRLPKKPLIISGGMTEVTSDIGWIRELKRYIRNLIKSNRTPPAQPVLGICFGAQIIAECMDEGSVRYLDDPEIGVSDIELDRPEHPLFRGFPQLFPAYSFHYNQIWSDCVEIISDHYHRGHHFIQAFEVPGSYAYGVQFHPEFRQDEMLRLFETYATLIAELGFDLAPVIRDLPEVEGNERIFRNFIDISSRAMTTSV